MFFSSKRLYEFGGWRLDPTERLLLLHGESVAVTPKGFDTLLLLVENSGRLVTKEEFMKRVWEDAFVEEAVLVQNISQLRKALGDSAVIETVPKKGYRFLGTVRSLSEPSSEKYADVREIAHEPSASFRRRSQFWRVLGWAIGGAGLTILALSAAFYFHTRSVRSTAQSIHSLAVLPLQNLSGDPNQEYFADGMTDELTTDLAQIHSLRVISRTSVMQFKQSRKSLPDIAAELNVDAVVEGSVLRNGNRVRITAQLLNAQQDRHLWAASYEREISNVLQLQGEVAKAIADQVNARLTPEEGANLSRSRTTNPQAYDALLTGKYLFNRRNAADAEKALGYFQHATDLDPNNPQAWAALASCYTSLGSDLGVMNRDRVLPPARAAIAKALSLEPNFAEAHTTFAWIKLWYDWDWRGAEQEFHRALELNPNDSVAHREYSHYLQLRKRFDEAVVENKRAIDLAPLDILPAIHLAWLYADARNGAKAVEQSKRVLEMDPVFIGAYLMLARGYELQGNWTLALAAIEHTKEQYLQAYLSNVAYIRAASGNKPEARRAFAKLTEFSHHNYVSPLAFAGYYATMGEKDEAIALLDRAYREHSPWMISLEVNDSFDTLRSDPRFQQLERQVGF
ncbi:MAG: hypothetical protein QOD84_1364 [Acidobacteriaceae bacterium]